MNPIKAAVEPMKADAIEKAAELVLAQVEGIREALEAANMDLDTAYPRFKGSCWDKAGQLQNKRRGFVELFVERDEPVQYYGARCYVKLSQKRIDWEVKRAKESAAARYDLFVAKLVAKIGAVESAVIEGNHVWGYSLLTVTKSLGGASETWKTQQIVNSSKLGLLFNQWPSRKLKGGR